MTKKISQDTDELIAKRTIAIFCKRSGRRWGASFLPDHDVLTLIESYFEARKKVGRGRMTKKFDSSALGREEMK